MRSLRNNLEKKAIKASARHSRRALASKARRQPLRSASLLTAGGVVGLVAGWFAGRTTARQGLTAADAARQA